MKDRNLNGFLENIGVSINFDTPVSNTEELQRTEEWHLQRLGKFTASKFKDISFKKDVELRAVNPDDPKSDPTKEQKIEWLVANDKSKELQDLIAENLPEIKAISKTSKPTKQEKLDWLKEKDTYQELIDIATEQGKDVEKLSLPYIDEVYNKTPGNKPSDLQLAQKLKLSIIDELYFSTPPTEVIIGGPTRGLETYIYENASELTTGIYRESDSKSIRWGRENEPKALEAYKKLYPEHDVQETGFQTTDKLGVVSHWIGASPDGLVNDDGALEIKSPYNSAIHLETIYKNEVPKNNLDQCQCVLLVTDRDWIDFISYDPRQKNPDLQLFVKRVYRDEEWISRFIKDDASKIERAINELKLVLDSLGYDYSHIEQCAD